jgi:hypothetical protein
MKFLLSMAAMGATCTAFGQGETEAILNYGGSAAAYVYSTAGWTFQTTQSLAVTDLGCFADVFANAPSVTAIQVGLWAPDGSLLASNIVTSASPLLDQTRYEPITPVSLIPGQTYHLGVYYSGGGIGVDVGGALTGIPVSTSAAVQLGAMALAGGGFTFPDELAGTGGSLYAGPNFLFQSQPLLTIQYWPTNQVRLSWPAAFPGYTPQFRPGLSGVWTNAGLTVTVVSNAYVAFDTIGPGPKYYRLIK